MKNGPDTSRKDRMEEGSRDGRLRSYYDFLFVAY